MPSKIFFSSCFTDPKFERLKLRDRIIKDINPKRQTGERAEVENFPVWMAESWKELDPPKEHDAPLPGRPLENAMFCIDGVRTSEVYFAVARQNYGSQIETVTGSRVQTSYFEIELFEAALLQKPAVIFLLEGAEPTGRLGSLLKLLEPALPGLDRTPRSEDYIYDRLKESLRYPKPSEAPFLRRAVASGPRMADQLMASRHNSYDPSKAGPSVNFLNGLSDPQTLPPDGTLVESVLAAAAAEQNHQRKLSLLWLAIRELMGAPPTRANDQFVPLWENALSAWNSAGAWYGLHGHPYMGCLASLSSLNAIRAERSGYMDGPHGGFASEYYSIAKHVRCSDYRQEAMRMSMKHIELEFLKGETSSKLGLRASIRYAMDDKDGAIEDHRRALDRRLHDESAENAAIGESMSELGFALVRNRKRDEGLRLMERGMEYLEAGPTTGFVVRAKRKLGYAYLLAGAPRLALAELVVAHQIAVAHGMDDQIGKIDRLATIVDSALPLLKANRRRPVVG